MSDDSTDQDLPSPAGQPKNEIGLAAYNCLHDLKGRVKFAGLHAYLHLEKAARLEGIDPEMFLLRLITAEEEAATALFFAFKHGGYKNAKALQYRSHPQKQALVPFLDIVHDFFDGLAVRETAQERLRVETLDGSRRLRSLARRQASDEWVQTELPFRFLLPINEKKQELTDFLRSRPNIKADIEKRVNTRNQILYAVDHGTPYVKDSAGAWDLKSERIDLVSVLTCLVAPHPVLSSAQQMLDLFLDFLEHHGVARVKWDS